MTNTIDITQVTTAVITLLITIITTFVVPYLKARLDAEQLKKLQEWTKIAVATAEMIYKSPKAGAQKKAYVIEFLSKKGYKLDLESVNNLIESAVYELTGVKRGN